MIGTLNKLLMLLKEWLGKNSTWYFLITLTIIVCFTISTLYLRGLIIQAFNELADGQYHYYMNINTSLQIISGKKFDPYDGSEKKELGTEQELVRKLYNKQKKSLRKLN